MATKMIPLNSFEPLHTHPQFQLYNTGSTIHPWRKSFFVTLQLLDVCVACCMWHTPYDSNCISYKRPTVLLLFSPGREQRYCQVECLLATFDTYFCIYWGKKLKTQCIWLQAWRAWIAAFTPFTSDYVIALVKYCCTHLWSLTAEKKIAPIEDR